MRRKTLKLAFAGAILAGCLGIGAAPRAAQAVVGCQPICCDPSCTSIRQCTGRPGNCICSPYCSAQ
jgi:hypothetical protein